MWKETSGRLEGREKTHSDLNHYDMFWKRGLTVMWGICDSWANGLQHAKPPVCSVLMLFIFSPSGRQSRLPEAEMIWRPEKPHHILAEVSPGIARRRHHPPSFLNGGLCLGAAFKKHMFVVTCQWAMGVVKGNFFFYRERCAVRFV